MKFNKTENKMSSLEWEKELNCYGLSRLKAEEQLKKDECLILDPDGWDRWHGIEKYNKSLNEKITREEFLQRVMKSTCITGNKWWK